jgi:hypothetical protein
MTGRMVEGYIAALTGSNNNNNNINENNIEDCYDGDADNHDSKRGQNNSNIATTIKINMKNKAFASNNSSFTSTTMKKT